MDWETVAKLAQEGFRNGVNEWIGKATVQGGVVNGPAATLTPGSLSSPVSLEPLIQQSLAQGKVPPEIAGAVARTLAAAWQDWAKGFQIVIPGAYPTLAAFPGPAAPPTPMAGQAPLRQGNSTGEASLNAAMLGRNLAGALRVHAMKEAGAMEKGMGNLAKWVESSFNEWKSMAMLTGLMGKGPVPTFAPPYVPVGPVVMGDNIGHPGGLFSGPRFGKVTVR
jgi:hypothetical protein